ncbi:unnamed protein product [[Candida] boidinii]|uniref:Unnamed protein product n=1 Tax=Candida boidinii TaxID=5477 RepID=A0A9W6SVY5_CANBO|nr:hypothetical protein B5S30_g846 [[Candida] boidinii]GME67458.1 unnamed protein product [[Candida] boidinii]GMF01627.1 unnamed protein product [[Candida] boidinii]GMF50728.1 unnamed protein product [[Candida] boidinii]GMF97616.1 unnamed protein product [[Candida] boidinii]
MSINWVMKNDGSNGSRSPFILLPSEIIKYESPLERTSLEIKPKYNSTILKEPIKAKGKIYISNLRIVFLSSEGDINTFSLLINQIKFFKLDTPFLGFGPNKWMCLFNSNDSNSGFIKDEVYELIFTFNEGGSFEFVKCFDDVYTSFINNQQEQLPAYHE